MRNRNNKTANAVSTDKLMHDLHAVVEDAEELLKATAGQAGEKISAVRERAQASLEAAKERLSEMREGLMDQARHAVESTDEYVRSNPWQAVGIGAAAGLLIGVLVARR